MAATVVGMMVVASRAIEGDFGWRGTQEAVG